MVKHLAAIVCIMATDVVRRFNCGSTKQNGEYA